MQRRTLLRVMVVALLAWACAILALSSLSPDELPDVAFVLWDKINHVIAFAVGGWLAASSLCLGRPDDPPAGRVVLAAIAVAAFGALDEGIQTLTPGRSGADVTDWLADLIGAAAGALLSLATAARLERLVGR